MKNSFLFNCRTTLKNIPAMRILAIATLFCFSSHLDLLQAQDPKLSVQGILKKSSGEAVDDGTYSLTFKLYTSPDPGPAAIWEETQMEVEVISGIYSTVLGNTVSLMMVPFDTIYFLGVTVGLSGSPEMKPRIQLTSAPYALSLIGENNKFPSSGQVIADSIDVNGNVLTQLGAPGNNGSGKNGYGFLGDKDSGLYSTAAGQVSLFVNNIEEVKVRPDSVVINGELRPENIRLDNGGKVSYNGLDDWRLVEIDYFENDVEGWKEYDPSNDILGWNTASDDGNPAIAGVNNHFTGKYIKPNEQNQVLKKQFNLSNVVGNYNFIKVKFKFYYLDSWDGQVEGDASFAAIAETVTGTGMRIGYSERANNTNYSGDFNTSTFAVGNQWAANTGWSEFTENAEMTFFKCTSCNNIFWLMFGASLNTDYTAPPIPDESWGVGMIEIWVK